MAARQVRIRTVAGQLLEVDVNQFHDMRVSALLHHLGAELGTDANFHEFLATVSWGSPGPTDTVTRTFQVLL